MYKYFFCTFLIVLSGCKSLTFPSQDLMKNDTAPILAGGIVGSVFGNLLNKEERTLGIEAELKALQNAVVDEVIEWSKPERSIVGRVKAAQFYRVGSQECRQYSHEIITNGVSNSANGTGCKNSDGSWFFLE
jgi:surface antigen